MSSSDKTEDDKYLARRKVLSVASGSFLENALKESILFVHLLWPP